MRGSHAKTTPPALVAWLGLEDENWKPSYPFPGDIRQPVVGSLLTAQRGLCVYCGRKLGLTRPGKSFHIEHFRPREVYCQYETDFANLYLSCGQETDSGHRAKTCGTLKNNWFDENAFIEPEYPECTNRFRFSLTGYMGPNVQDDVAADTMIAKLNLNHPEFVRERKEILFCLDELSGQGLNFSDFVDNESGIAESYAHMVGLVLGETIP